LNNYTGWNGRRLESNTRRGGKSNAAKRGKNRQLEERRAEARNAETYGIGLGAIKRAQAVIDPETKRLRLYEYQKEFFERWINDRSIIVLCGVWGRGAGKTTTACSAAAFEAVSRDGNQALWITPTYEQGEDAKRTTEYILKQWGALKNPMKHAIECSNDSVIEYCSWWQAENLLGKHPDSIYIDEARLLESIDMGMVFWPMVLNRGSRIMMISSAGAEVGFFYEAVQMGKPGPGHRDGFATYEVWSEKNPLCDQQRLDIMRDKWGRLFERECHCVFMQDSEEGYLFDQKTMEAAKISEGNTEGGLAEGVREQDAVVREQVVFGIDSAGCLGGSGWVVMRGNTVAESGLQYFGGFEPLLAFVEAKVREIRPDCIGLDGTSAGGNAFDYMVRDRLKRIGYECPVYPVVFNQAPDNPDSYANFRSERLFMLRDAMLDGEVKIDASKHRELVLQLQSVRMEPDIRGRQKCVSKKNRRSEDIVDALLIAREAAKLYGPKQQVRVLTEAEQRRQWRLALLYGKHDKVHIY